jgi:hypothetical protein
MSQDMTSWSHTIWRHHLTRYDVMNYSNMTSQYKCQNLYFIFYIILFLDLVLHILYQGLQTKDLSCVSAKSLQKVCTSCQKRMAHHFSILLQIVQAIDSLSISAGAVLEFFQGELLLISCRVKINFEGLEGLPLRKKDIICWSHPLRKIHM